MNTFTFQVKKSGGSSFLITFEGTTFDEALAKVHELYADEHNAIAIVDSREGTLEDYIGPESIARIEERKTRSREVEGDANKRYAKISKAGDK